MIQIILIFWILTQLNAPTWIWGACFVWATVKVITIIQKVYKSKSISITDEGLNKFIEKEKKRRKSFQDRLTELAEAK